jgi:hypothetical protein
MSYELIEDYQCVNSKKQITIIPKGIRLDNAIEGNYKVKVKGDVFLIEEDVVLSNPQYFKKIDLTSELTEIFKKNKKATAPKLAKIVVEYLEQNVFRDKNIDTQ